MGYIFYSFTSSTDDNEFKTLCLFLFKVQRLFSELLTGKNSALLKYAGHLVFQNCRPAAILSEKYTGYLVFFQDCLPAETLAFCLALYLTGVHF